MTSSIDHHSLPETAAETLVGGAPVSTDIVAIALTRAPRLVAADGGADTVLAAGLRPARVIGDMDSVSQAARAAFCDVLAPVTEQDSTDFDKALRQSQSPFVIGVGFIGARVDHFLACLTTLARRREAAPCLLLGDEDCLCILPAEVRLKVPVGTRVSLWPLGPATGQSRGLEWPIDGIEFSPGGRVGTSNRSTLPDVWIATQGAPMALILPASQLDAMLEMLKIWPRDAGASAL